MIKIEDLVQLKAFARQDGAILCLLWFVSFLAIMYMPESGLGNILALLTPILVGWRLCAFRNYALGGYISFRRSYGYCVYTFVYSSMIFALGQYLYFKFLDHGTFYAMLATSSVGPVDTRHRLHPCHDEKPVAHTLGLSLHDAKFLCGFCAELAYRCCVQKEAPLRQDDGMQEQ